MDRSSGRRATVAKGGDGSDAQMRTHACVSHACNVRVPRPRSPLTHACGRVRRTRGREPTRDGVSTVSQQ
eukprot:6646727-Prymnesium_polylepis.1